MEIRTDYRDRIRRVMLHIEENLGEQLNLRDVAKVACFSEYHFHRIFVTHVGMTLQEFITYRRLCRAADLLLSSSMRIIDIAFEVGFESSSSFTTSFKKLFLVTPNTFRKNGGAGLHLAPGGLFNPLGFLENPQVQRQLRVDKIRCEIREVPEMKVLSIPKSGFYNGCFFKAAQDGFMELYTYLDKNDLWKKINKRLSILPELPYSMNDPDAVIHCGFSTEVDISPDNPFDLQIIEGGKYAVFPYLGPYEYSFQTWIVAYYKCFLAGNEQVRDVAPFEVYLNSPRDTPPEELRTEIHIPIL